MRLNIAWPDVQVLVPLTPAERRRHVAAYLRRVRDELLASPLLRDASVEKSWVRGRVEARHVNRLLADSRIFVEIVRIPGVRKVKENGPGSRWYAVQARFAIQIEGETKGLQSFEDRIVVVEAKNEEDATRRLLLKFCDYGEPYVGGEYRLVRWQFERVLEVQELLDQEIDPRGTEVFSSIKQRRLRPEFTW